MPSSATTARPGPAAFAAGCDVVTFDHEHVPQAQLVALEQAGLVVSPSAAALRFTQDKLAMRERLTSSACPARGTGRWCPLLTSRPSARRTSWPVVLKAVSGGYDGRGVWVCLAPARPRTCCRTASAVIAEEYVPFERELAVLVAALLSGHGAAYPVVQTVQQDGICREVLAPAPGLPEVSPSRPSGSAWSWRGTWTWSACWQSSCSRPATAGCS